MRIAFDAKRAFQNTTGLGNYSRSLISALADRYPQHTYYLFTPQQTPLYKPEESYNMHVVLPREQLHKWLRSAWRSKYAVKDLQRQQVDIYHGLSHEIPFGIQHSGVRSVVTMHDLIFERYPRQYNPIDVRTYRSKAIYACRHADQVIAISEQTKEDLITFYKTPPEKITVAYQSCDPVFSIHHSQEEIAGFRARHHLPANYFLYVGSVIERKNLLAIIQAMQQLKGQVDIPLVILGDGKQYKKKVKLAIAEAGLQQRVIWLNEQARLALAELPLLYQGAQALLYPSIFEGFGIPILEALWSRTPVITSQGSCFGETAGDAAIYIDPLHPESLAAAMQQILDDQQLVASMKEKGWIHAHRFTPERCAEGVMTIYQSVMNQ